MRDKVNRGWEEETTSALGRRYVIAQQFAELMRKVADAQTPWAAFRGRLRSLKRWLKALFSR